MSAPQTAIRYAQALWELADAAGKLPLVREDMAAIDRINASLPEIREYCLSQSASQKDAHQLVESAFCPHLSQLTADTLRLMASNGRLAAVPLLTGAFAGVEERRTGKVEVILESARTASPDLVAVVTRSMAERTGQEIHLVQRVRPELKGGFRVLWQNKVIDHSIQGRLRALHSLLKSV